MNFVRILAIIGLMWLMFGATSDAQTVDVYGQTRIYAGNPSNGVGVNDVAVYLYDTAHTVEYVDVSHTDVEFMNAHNLTSPDGIYYFDDVPYRLDYWVEIVIPEGYVRATNPEAGSWWNANPRELLDDFYNCFLLFPYNPHTIGYWKHQCNVVVKGKGNAQVPEDELEAILVSIFDHWDNDTFFPVVGVSSIGEVWLEPEDALETFKASNGGSQGMIHKAKKQLLALLMSVEAGYLSPFQPISDDDRLIEEAIFFAADMITSEGDDIETAKDVCDYINNGFTVPAGWIPEGYLMSSGGYCGGEAEGSIVMVNTPTLISTYPNPFNPETTLQFSLPEASEVNLTVYNLQGQVVNVLVSSMLEAGQHNVNWNASHLPSGTYIYRLTSSQGQSSGKMVLVK
ncbi:T9SS type A sorting domain-containing protein [bacterium]|nr:T9SS type A sorting domain-containing protein [bacterium]